MTRDNLVKLLKILKAKNIITNREGWVDSSCLFAKHKHQSGKDSSPSAGFKIEQGKSRYWCFTCGSYGDVGDVLTELLVLNKMQGWESPEIAAAFYFIENEDIFTFEPMDYEDTSDKKVFFEFPAGWLDNFSPVANVPSAVAYLESRIVPKQIWTDFDLRFDHAKQAILFPYKNTNGKLAGARGRIIDPMSKNKHYDYSYKSKNNTSLTWYRESELDETKPLVVVEGEFDCSRVYQQYRNCTAILTALVSDPKLERLLYFPEILWMSDNDKAGLQSREKARAFFESKNRVFNDLFVPEEYKDPDLMPPRILKYILKEFVGVDELIL